MKFQKFVKNDRLSADVKPDVKEQQMVKEIVPVCFSLDFGYFIQLHIVIQEQGGSRFFCLTDKIC